MAKHFDIETHDGQAAAEAADDKALIDRAMKHENPGDWLAKVFHVGGVSPERSRRVRLLLSGAGGPTGAGEEIASHHLHRQ